MDDSPFFDVMVSLSNHDIAVTLRDSPTWFETIFRYAQNPSPWHRRIVSKGERANNGVAATVFQDVRMKEYFVYILHCGDDSFYIGVTNNYETRLAEHQRGLNPESYTANRLPVMLVHLEVFSEITYAIDREKQLKRWSRKKKQALIRKEWEKLPPLAARRIRYQRKAE